MSRTFAVPMNDDLAVCDANGHPVWGLIPWDLSAQQFSRNDGWKHQWHYESSDKWIRIRIVTTRGWFRGVRLTLTQNHDDSARIRISVGRFSTVRERLPAIGFTWSFAAGLIIGLLARIIGGKEAILIQMIPLLGLFCGALGISCAWIVAWLLTQFTALGWGRLRRLTRELQHALTAPEAVSEYAARFLGNPGPGESTGDAADAPAVWRFDDNAEGFARAETWMLPLLFPHGGLLALLAVLPESERGTYWVVNAGAPDIERMLSGWFERGTFEFTVVDDVSGREHPFATGITESQIEAFNTVLEYNRGLECLDFDAAFADWNEAFNETVERLGSTINVIFDIHDRFGITGPDSDVPPPPNVEAVS